MKQWKQLLAVGAAAALGMSGCAAMQDREWDGCAIGGAVIGAVAGGAAAGVGVHEGVDDAGDEEVAGAAAGGAVAGAALGAVLGHLICDPVKEVPPPPPPPPPPPAPKKIVELHGPNFDFNKATLKPSGKKLVDTAVKAMKDNASMRVSVEGHTDAIGSEAYNQKLSEHRANSVRDYMVSQGVASSRITTVGHGKSKPIANNATEDGRAQNRRVEILTR